MGSGASTGADGALEVKSTGAWPKPLYKDSKLILPKDASGELATIIAVHGMCAETEFANVIMFTPMLAMSAGLEAGMEHALETDRGRSWTYMQPLTDKDEPRRAKDRKDRQLPAMKLP